jgi:hypothetical protein
MIAIKCPVCSKPMQIEDEPNTEWECPSCGGVFLIAGGSAGGLRFEITEAGKHQFAAGPPDPEVKDDVYVYVVEQLAKGCKAGDVRKSLIASGHPAPQADRIIQKAIQLQKDYEKTPDAESLAQGNRMMMIGGIIVLVGLSISILTFLIAQATGGSFAIATGAIFWGAVLFFRGAARKGPRS